MDFNEEVNCETCKYGYYNGVSDDMEHNLCGANRCYLCAEQYEYCDMYECGTIPYGTESVLNTFW